MIRVALLHCFLLNYGWVGLGSIPSDCTRLNSLGLHSGQFPRVNSLHNSKLLDGAIIDADTNKKVNIFEGNLQFENHDWSKLKLNYKWIRLENQTHSPKLPIEFIAVNASTMVNDITYHNVHFIMREETFRG